MRKRLAAGAPGKAAPYGAGAPSIPSPVNSAAGSVNSERRQFRRLKRQFWLAKSVWRRFYQPSSLNPPAQICSKTNPSYHPNPRLQFVAAGFPFNAHARPQARTAGVRIPAPIPQKCRYPDINPDIMPAFFPLQAHAVPMRTSTPYLYTCICHYSSRKTGASGLPALWRGYRWRQENVAGNHGGKIQLALLSCGLCCWWAIACKCTRIALPGLSIKKPCNNLSRQHKREILFRGGISRSAMRIGQTGGCRRWVAASAALKTKAPTFAVRMN
jgi:hypothetical protein